MAHPPVEEGGVAPSINVTLGSGPHRVPREVWKDPFFVTTLNIERYGAGNQEMASPAPR